MTPLARRLLALALLLVCASGAVAAARLAARRDQFDHARHRALFPSCESCHAGVATAGATAWPAPAACATCHDGTIQRRTDWAAPAALPRTNLRFDHVTHLADVAAHRPAIADSAGRCASCHIQQGGQWMDVRLAIVGSCLACHGVTAAHLSAPDTACATCHVPLAAAGRLTASDVGRFPIPASHRDSAFRMGGHGARAHLAGGPAVASSCATCHAREFCATCHVNAPEVKPIQALASDPRSLAIATVLRAPDSHGRPDFIFSHGRAAGQGTCASCHTRESCATCHADAPPKAVMALHRAGAGRGTGAIIVRRRPESHGPSFADSHAAIARATPRSCAACHSRTDCLDCHRPDAASGAGSYHPAGFLTRHPAAAYSRQTSCAGCHNQATFCATCHERAGLVSRGTLRAGFHDAKPGFILGHGQAARQSLESCTSCHAERDCLTCHASAGGRRFNPHGPGFDAARLRRRNPAMCTACHGEAIPGS